jgi:hypothetical protein
MRQRSKELKGCAIAHMRTQVETSPDPVRFRRQVRGEFSVVVVGDVIHNKCPVLTHGVDVDGTREVGLNSDENVSVQDRSP